MARNFRRHRAPTSQPIADLNVTNLIDLGFMLLIIFMVATPLMQQEQTIPINLPLESKNAQSKIDPNEKFESITIRADGTYALSGRTMTLPQLERELTRFGAQPKPPVFRLRMDGKSNAQQIVSVLAELRKNNLRPQFDTRIAE
ncbi:MAG: biopolymer transporter ExbD [Opitutaceae bacterium]